MVLANHPTALSNVTPNRNFFVPIQAEFSIRRLPNVEFFCQRAVLPGISIAPVAQKNPLVDIYHSGEVIEFGEFQVEFVVDELMANYTSVFSWMVDLGFPNDSSQYLELSSPPAWSDAGPSSDCSLFFLDSKGRPKIECIFEQAFPVSLSGVAVDVREQETKFSVATALFRYTKFTLNSVV